MKDDRAFRLWQEDFQTPFRRWRRNKRDEGALLRGGQLAEAERWRSERGDALTADEFKFIDEGIRLRKRTEWRRKVAVAASLLVAAVMAGVGAYAWYASNEAERNAALAQQEAKRATAETERAEAALRASQAEYLVRQGQDLFDADPLVGIRLALEGLKHVTDGKGAPPASIVDVALEMTKQGHLFKFGRDIISVVSNRLNTRIVIDHRHGPGELRRSADGELLATLAGNINEVTFSPDAEAGVFVVGYLTPAGELRRQRPANCGGARTASCWPPSRAIRATQG